MATSIYRRPSFASWKTSSAAATARSLARDARLRAVERPGDAEAERAALIAEQAAEEAYACWETAHLISISPGEEMARFRACCQMHHQAWQALERAKAAVGSNQR